MLFLITIICGNPVSLYACDPSSYEGRGDHTEHNPNLLDWFLQQNEDQKDCNKSRTEVDGINSELSNPFLQ